MSHDILAGSRGRRGGFTLLETIIASAIGLVLMGIVGASYLAMLRAERSNSLVLGYVSDAMRVERLLFRHASAARQTVAADGLSARIANRAGAVSEFRYEDADKNWRTIGDNRLVFVENIDKPAKFVVAARFVTPPNNGTGPIFSRVGSNAFSPMEIHFLMGDYSRDPKAKCNATTGPGFQSFAYRTKISPRNSF